MIDLDLSIRIKLAVIWIILECYNIADLILDWIWIISAFYCKFYAFRMIPFYIACYGVNCPLFIFLKNHGRGLSRLSWKNGEGLVHREGPVYGRGGKLCFPLIMYGFCSFNALLVCLVLFWLLLILEIVTISDLISAWCCL